MEDRPECVAERPAEEDDGDDEYRRSHALIAASTLCAGQAVTADRVVEIAKVFETYLRSGR